MVKTHILPFSNGEIGLYRGGNGKHGAYGAYGA